MIFVIGRCGGRRRGRFGWRHFPPELSNGVAGMFIILDPEIMIPFGKGIINHHFACTAVYPLINDEHVINPDAHAIIHRRMEAVEAGGKVELACPARRKIIYRDGRIRRPRPPVKANVRIVAHQSGRAREIAIGPIFSLPIRIGSADWGRCRQRHNRRWRRRCRHQDGRGNHRSLGEKICINACDPTYKSRIHTHIEPVTRLVLAQYNKGVTTINNGQHGIISRRAGAQIETGWYHLARQCGRNCGGDGGQCDGRYNGGSDGHSRDGGCDGRSDGGCETRCNSGCQRCCQRCCRCR